MAAAAALLALGLAGQGAGSILNAVELRRAGVRARRTARKNAIQIRQDAEQEVFLRRLEGLYERGTIRSSFAGAGVRVDTGTPLGQLAESVFREQFAVQRLRERGRRLAAQQVAEGRAFKRAARNQAIEGALLSVSGGVRSASGFINSVPRSSSSSTRLTTGTGRRLPATGGPSVLGGNIA
ncbi:MAG: hypothetical protein AAF430_22085 [Myxococcota bacterium]